MFQVLTKVACGGDKIILDDIPSKIPQLTSEVFTLLLIAVPLLLVIMGTIDLYKGITADKEDEIVKGRKLFIKRLIIGAIVFLIMGITKLVISVIDNSSNSSRIINCVDCFISGPDKCQANPVKEITPTYPEEEEEDVTGSSSSSSSSSSSNRGRGNSSGSSSSSSGSTNTEVINVNDNNGSSSTEVINVNENNNPLGKETGAFSNVNYYLYVPTNATKGMPLVIFLHGIGEKGNMNAVKNLKPVTTITDGTLSGLEKFIFLAPTSPSSTHWGDYTTWDNLINLINYITDEYSIDASRIYLTGFSAGGCGVWGLVNKYPNKFGAAVAVSCTPGSITYSNFRNTPLYAISGGAENYVTGMKNTVNAINAAGGNAQFKTIPNAGHIATQNSYSTRELYMWLLSQ